MYLVSGQAYTFASFVGHRSFSGIPAARCLCHVSRSHYHRASTGVHSGRSHSRRQLLKSTSLAVLAGWLPFGRMSSNAFQLPGDKWWRPDTVAVVTGGTSCWLIVVTSLDLTDCQLIQGINQNLRSNLDLTMFMQPIRALATGLRSSWQSKA